MANILKNGAVKIRDKAQSKLLTLLRDLLESVEKLNGRIEEVRHIDLEINHNQLNKLDEINQRTKNSGNVLISESEVVTKIFSGIKMYLDPRDIAVAPHLMLDSIWEHRITSAWLAVIKPNFTVIDVGANFGYYGALAAQKTSKKSSKIIFFEANPHLIKYINKTLSVNWLNEQSIVENLAVADKSGKLTLHILKDYIGSSSIHDNKDVDKYMHNKMNLETAEDVEVKAISIDEYFDINKIATANLVKMDIEGYEDKAYQGMRKLVKRSPDITLFVEFTKEAYTNPKQFYELMLNDFGYVYSINDEGYITRPNDTSYENIIGDSDDWVMPIFSKNKDLANK